MGGFTIEDANIVQFPEISGNHVLVVLLVYFETRLFGQNEDLVVPLDVQLDLGRAVLSIYAGDGEVVDANDLRGGDHGQVDHSI